MSFKQLEKDAKKYKVPNNCIDRVLFIEKIPNFVRNIPQLEELIKKIESKKPDELNSLNLINPDDKKWKKTKSKCKVAGKHIDVITIPKDHKMYKGFNSFITEDMEKEYMKTIVSPVVAWYSIRSIYSLVYSMELNGGLNVYNIKRDTKLAVWNTQFIEAFYKALLDIIKKNPNNQIYKDLAVYYKISLGHDVSNKERLIMLAHYKPFGKYNEEWDTLCFDYREEAWDFDNFDYTDIGGFQRMRGLRTVLYRYLILPILIHMGIDGVLVPQHKNPFIPHGGIFSQEIIFHSPDSITTRNTKDPLDWTNWKELDKELPNIRKNGFSIGMSSANKNHDLRMMKWFMKQKELESDLTKSTKFKSDYVKQKDSSLSICTLNVLGLASIDGTQNTNNCIDHLCAFVKSINCDIICLQEVHRGSMQDLVPKFREVGFLYNTKLNEKFGNVIFSKLSIKKSKEVVIRSTDDKDNSSKHSRTAMNIQLFIELLNITTTHLSIGDRYHDKGLTKAQQTKIKTNNDNIRLEEVKNIIKSNGSDDSSNIDLSSDIILGDFNAINTDPAIKYILDNGYVTNQSNIKETNPFGTIIDHIFLSKKFVQNYKSYKILSYPYVWSDHNAIILIIEDFF
jgi:exonuclease III